MGVHSNIAAMGRRSPAMGERKNMRAALLDTKGPEVRTGLLADGAKSITLEEGAAIELTYDPAARECGTAARLYCDYQQLATTVGPGSMILLDDGLIALEVEATRPAREGGDPHGAVECRVRNGGVLGATKGVNLPGAILELPAMTEKDKDDLRWCVENDFDYVAASFVRKAHDVRSVVAFLERCCDDVRRARAKAQGVPPEDVEVLRPLVISKIESQEGVLNFDEILAASDGIMVARGDLGVEIPFAELLVIQKRMVRQCNEAGKPVIVATQMLDSMQRNPRPTRAEVTDVGNAVLDGADAVMLSGETSVGKYPFETVRTMARIVCAVEENSVAAPPLTHVPRTKRGVISYAARDIGERLDAKALVAFTQSGDTVRRLARLHTPLPVLAFTALPEVRSQLALTWGTETFIVPHIETTDGMIRQVDRSMLEMGRYKRGDLVVIVAGAPPGTVGSTNLIHVHRIGEDDV